MGQLVFQAALGGQTNLVGGNTASTYNLNVPTANDTLVGRATTDTLTNKTLTTPTMTNPTITGYTETVYALGTSGSIALNPANGTVQTCAASGTVTFTDSLSAGQSLVLMLTNGSTYTINFPTITWVGPNGNTAPTLNGGNTLVFWKVSTTLYGASVGKYA